MNNDKIEYLILSNATPKSIVTKTNAKLADIKYAALLLKREGAISEDDAKRYFDAQPVIKEEAPRKPAKAPAKKPVEKTEDAPAPTPKVGRRRRSSKTEA